MRAKNLNNRNGNNHCLIIEVHIHDGNDDDGWDGDDDKIVQYEIVQEKSTSQLDT